jgi:hypothetical protein
MRRHSRFRTLLVALSVVAALAGCDILSPDAASRVRLDDARARWEGAGIQSYEYRYRRQMAEGLLSWQRPFRVRVVDGAVVAVVDAESEEAPPEGFSAPTVPELFDIVDDALDRADSIAVEYHPQYGYPTSISIDYSFQVADDEFWITAEALTPLP